ncbi:Na+/H+ antiporter [Rariglobus hedericola]|uniref:Na+/H+ antiporter n=1 Tax=Rariglobus hedericola TaxID=2597822 RepID=A0A556QR95_9BACT|nr:Na+/H+ antiporter [Rariglobus hedericola]TSJ79165.1 Na+/H+ antiporter [Rariglobus hedericola]
MAAFEHALILILLLTVLSVLGRRLPWPMPITQVVGAGLIALWPEFPRVELDPGFFFLCFVPPLLFADGWLMPLRDFMAAKRSILTLATGLVVFTTIAVGLVAHWLIPSLPLAMAFALGAVVSPTDAVAVGAITQRLKVPARLNTILNGESLMNDATGLVAFKFAIAAVIAGTFSVRAAAIDFVWLAVGGVAVGFALGWLVGRGRDFLRTHQGSDIFVETTLSLLTPYAAYLAADALGLSSILAVVTAGLYSGMRDPLRTDVETRQTSLAVWSVVLFWLNGLAFILLGLQLPSVLAAVSKLHPTGELLWFTAAVAGAAILTRLIWIFPGAYLPFVFFKKSKRLGLRPPWQSVMVTGWAGMRGTVTLAAALSIPKLLADGSPFPGRDMVIFLSLGVIMVTLLLQGTTLEWLICKLGVRADNSQLNEDRIARIAAVEAGLKVLRASENLESRPEEVAALGNVLAEYEHRLAELTAEGETRTSARLRQTTSRHHRLQALHAERAAVDDLWQRDIITDETHHPLQSLLDHEESMLKARPAETIS